MEFLITPPQVHSAFNPIIVHVSAANYDRTPPDVELTIKYGFNHLVTLVRKPTYDIETDGEYGATFDISGVIQSLFPHSSTGLWDKRLYVNYTIDVNDNVEPPLQLMAINASAYPRTSIDWAKYQQTGMYHNNVVHIYEGYKRDITILNLEDKVVERVDIISENSDQEYRKTISGLSVIISPQCTPFNPFYVRWLNKLGGIDYYMFGYFQEFESAVKDINSLQADNNGFSRTFSAKSEEKIIVGADRLSLIDYIRLIEMPTSPIIEWYNESADMWVPATIIKANNKRNNSITPYSIEIELQVPVKNLQFI